MKINNKIQAWTAWFTCSLFLAYQYILRVMPNILLPNLMEKFHISANQIGQISSGYYLGYSLMHIPLGILLDKFSPKYILPIFLLVTSFGTLPLIYSDVWGMVAFGRLLVGIGSSAAILGLFKIIRMGFGENRFSFMLGISVTIGFSGALYGSTPMLNLIQAIGYENTILYLIALGLALAIILYITLPSEQMENNTQFSIKADIKSILSNRQFFFLCLIGGLMVGPIEGFADTWANEFLKKEYHLTKETAASLASLIFIGMCFGAPFISLVADKTRAYFSIIFISAASMALGLLLVLYGNISEILLTFIFIIVGVFSSYQSIIIYKAITFVPENLKSLAAASANMIIMIFGSVFHNSIGFTMDFLWTGDLLNGTRIYTIDTYKYALSVIPLSCIVAGIALIFFVIYQHQYRTRSLIG